MKAVCSIEVKVILEMAKEEAIWLRGLTQNPINIPFGEEENKYDSVMRQKFFQALNEELA